jgi:hypothetical protein
MNPFSVVRNNNEGIHGVARDQGACKMNSTVRSVAVWLLEKILGAVEVQPSDKAATPTQTPETVTGKPSSQSGKTGRRPRK